MKLMYDSHLYTRMAISTRFFAPGGYLEMRENWMRFEEQDGWADGYLEEFRVIRETEDFNEHRMSENPRWFSDSAEVGVF